MHQVYGPLRGSAQFATEGDDRKRKKEMAEKLTEGDYYGGPTSDTQGPSRMYTTRSKTYPTAAAR